MFGRGKAPPPAPGLRRAPMRLLPLGRGEHLADLLGGDRARISAPEAQVLAQCSNFRPLETHARDLAQRSGGDPQQFQQILQELHSAGLLCEPPAWLGQHDSAASPAPRLATSLITAHRPDIALRALSDLLSLRASGNESGELLVVDDSDDTGKIQRLRDGAQQLARTSGASIRLVNRADKQAWAEQLQRRLANTVPAQRLRDALVNASGQLSRCGTNRNLQQLALCGRAFVSVDDDTLARYYPAPTGQTSKTRAHSRGDPLQAWHYPTRDEVWAANSGEGIAPDDVHRQLLGATVSSSLDSTDALDNLDDAALHALAQGRVKASMTGAAGDCGMGVPAYFLWNAGPSLDRLTADAEHYAATRFGRNVLRLSPQTTVSRAPLFMGASTGYDNRATLPPFLPVGRNADGIFGYSLLRCDATAWIGHVPLAVHHDPPNDRPRDIEAGLTQPGGLMNSNLLCAFIASTTNNADISVEDAMISLGHALLSATHQAPQFKLLTLQLGTRMLSAQVQRLDALLEQRGAQPSWWAADIEALRETAAQAATNPAQHLFGDWSGPDDHRFERARQTWHHFGALLIDWSDIRAAASDALADDVQPGRLL